MNYKIKFETEEEKEKLILENSHLTLIHIACHKNENYLLFTDEEIIFELTETEILNNKISILEKENADLLLDNAMKDFRLEALESDVADILIEMAGGM